MNQNIFAKKEYIVISYSNFNALVKENYPNSDYEFNSDHESCNDNVYRFDNITKDDWKEWDSWELEKFEKFKTGGNTNFVTRMLTRESPILLRWG